MQMHTSRSSSYGPTAVFTMSTCFWKCSNTLWWPAEVPMRVQSAGAKEGHCLSGTFQQDLPPWNLSIMTPGTETLKPCTMMSTYYAGCLVKAGAKSRWQSGFARRSWLPSRSTSGFSSHPSSRWDSRCSDWPKFPGPILPQLLLPPTKRPMRRWWHLQGRPNNEPLLQLQSSQKGWVAPLTTNTPPTINALPATGDWNPLDSKKKVPRWLHAEGALQRENEPGHPAWQDGNIGWHSLKEGYQCHKQQGKVQGVRQKNASMTLRHRWATSCPHYHGRRVSNRLMQHCRRWWVGHDDVGRPKPPQMRMRMWTLRACCNSSPVSSDSWGRKSPLQWVLMQETASFCCHCWHHHHHYHCCCYCFLRIQSPPPAFNQMEKVVCQVCQGSILVGRVDASPGPNG